MEEPPVHYYSPNDYIYQSVGSNLAPNDSYCSLIENTVSCGPNNPSDDCIKKEYCINKKYAEDNTNKHLGAEGRFLDTISQNKSLLETTICYSVGILGVVVFLFLNR